MRFASGRELRYVVASAAATVLLFTSASGGAAQIVGSNLNYREKTVTVAAGAAVAATANCPSGQKMVTGGAYFHPTTSRVSDPTLSTEIRSSAPKLDQTGWYATGKNKAGVTLAFTTSVKCLPKSAIGTYTVRKREVTVDGHRPGNADLKCKTGQIAVAAGGAWHKPGLNPKPGLNARVTFSMPDFRAEGWSVGGQNDSSSTLVLRVTVYCVPTSVLGGGYTSSSGAGVPMLPGTALEVYQACGVGTYAIAAGVGWGYDGSSSLGFDIANTIQSSGPTDYGTDWYFSVRSTDSRFAQTTLSVTVYCR